MNYINFPGRRGKYVASNMKLHAAPRLAVAELFVSLGNNFMWKILIVLVCGNGGSFPPSLPRITFSFPIIFYFINLPLVPHILSNNPHTQCTVTTNRIIDCWPHLATLRVYSIDLISSFLLINTGHTIRGSCFCLGMLSEVCCSNMLLASNSFNIQENAVKS